MRRLTLIALLLSSAALAEPRLFLAGRSGGFRAAAFSPDARLIATASQKGVTIWEISSGLEVFAADGDAAQVAFAPDEKALWAAGEKDLRQWELPSGRLVRTVKPPGEAHALAISPDGALVAVGAAGTALIYGAADGVPARAFTGKGAATSVAFSADGKLFAIGWSRFFGSDEHKVRVEVWQLEGGKAVSSWEGDGSVLQDLAITGRTQGLVNFTRHYFAQKEMNIDTLRTDTGALLASGVIKNGAMAFRGLRGNPFVASEGRVYEWDLGKNAEVRTVLSGAEGSQLSFSADGALMATGRWGRAEIAVHRFDDGKLLQRMGGVARRAFGVALDARGERLAAGGAVLDLRAARELTDLGAGRAGSLDWWPKQHRLSPDGRVVASAYEGGLRLSDASSGRELFKVPGAAGAFAFSPDGKLFATEGKDDTDSRQYKVFDVSTGQLAFAGCTWVLFHAMGFVGNDFVSVCGNPRSEEHFEIRDLATGQVRTVPLGEIWVTDFLFALPGGSEFICGAWLKDHSVLIRWNAATGRVVRSAPLERSSKAAVLSPDGSTLFIDHRGYRTDTLEKVRALPEELLADGLAFSGNGKVLLRSNDGVIRLLDARSFEEIAAVYFTGERDWVVLAKDGRFDGTPGGMKKLHYADDLRALPLEALSERYYSPGLLAQALTGELGELKPARPLRLGPMVSIESPPDGAALDSEAAEVIVSAQDQGGGVDEVRLYQNGKLVSDAARGVKKKGERRSFSITLLAGENELRAVALDRERTESQPAVIKISLKAPEPQAALRGVIVGINRYKNATYSLNYGRPDAEAFAAALKKQAPRIFKSADLIEIYDGAATRKSIEAAFDKTITTARPEDVFVFYFAGHGVMSEGAPDAPAEFYLVPSDVTRLYGDDELLRKRALPASFLREKAVKVPARKQLFALDACQSGGAVEAFAFRGAAEQKAIFQLARSAGVVVLASSGTQQLAAEVKDLGHGVFTYALLKALDGAAGQGKITVKQVEAYLNDEIPELTKKYRGSAQYPASYARGMDFPLAVK